MKTTDAGKRKIRQEGTMNKDEEVKMTHSGIVKKDGKRTVLIRFERGDDVAEGSIPPCKIASNRGFSQEEVESLEQYLQAQSETIFAKAKELNDLRKIL
jgi:hypothetical protein